MASPNHRNPQASVLGCVLTRQEGRAAAPEERCWGCSSAGALPQRFLLFPPAQDHHSPAAAPSAPPGFKTNLDPPSQQKWGGHRGGEVSWCPWFHPNLCPAPHNPALQHEEPGFGALSLLKGFPSAPGHKGYLADSEQGQGKVSQALKKMKLSDLSTSPAP